MTCKFCGKEGFDLRGGCCFDCACQGEERAAKRTILEHLAQACKSLSHGYFSHVRFDVQWAWQRFWRTGDYARGGYFDAQNIDWKKKRD